MGSTGQSACTVAGSGSARNKNTAANFSKMRYTGVWLLLRAVLAPWAAVGKSARCVFFNMGVFYHPPGVFYTMGCYKMPKIISKIKSYATRPPIKYFFRTPDPHPVGSLLTPPAPRQCAALPATVNCTSATTLHPAA